MVFSPSVFIMLLILCFVLCNNALMVSTTAKISNRIPKSNVLMKVENDAFRKANREMRKAGAGDRSVELKL